MARMPLVRFRVAATDSRAAKVTVIVNDAAATMIQSTARRANPRR
jgi:hypothetical protein